MYFVLKEGYIISENDGDRHFISADRLRKLYNVPYDANMVTEDFMKRNRPNLSQDLVVVLEPQFYGNYNLFDGIEKQVLFTYKPMWEDMAIKRFCKMSFWERLKFLFLGGQHGQPKIK